MNPPTPRFRFISRTVLALSASAGIFLASCEKKTQGPYDIQVLVVNDEGLPIQNCLIRMYAPVGADGTINAYAKTGFDGRALFEYSYPAYLQLDAVKGSWKGCGFAELRDQNLVETTVVIKPFSDPNNGCPPI
jgi:hypothetical protein